MGGEPRREWPAPVAGATGTAVESVRGSQGQVHRAGRRLDDRERTSDGVAPDGRR